MVIDRKLAPFVEPIAIAIIVLLLGIVLGGVGFLLILKKKHNFIRNNKGILDLSIIRFCIFLINY